MNKAVPTFKYANNAVGNGGSNPTQVAKIILHVWKEEISYNRRSSIEIGALHLLSATFKTKYVVH